MSLGKTSFFALAFIGLSLFLFREEEVTESKRGIQSFKLAYYSDQENQSFISHRKAHSAFELQLRRVDQKSLSPGDEFEVEVLISSRNQNISSLAFDWKLSDNLEVVEGPLSDHIDNLSVGTPVSKKIKLKLLENTKEKLQIFVYRFQGQSKLGNTAILPINLPKKSFSILKGIYKKSSNKKYRIIQ